MLLQLSEEDVEMLKRELGYCRCLYWDGKLKCPEGYCDGMGGDCCKKKMTIEKWLEEREVK